MTSTAKFTANRNNAKKSTGPKTQAGKRASSRNAARHAILSVVPVLPGVESAKDWEAHRSAMIASIAPVGYLETVLADRAASLLWRLGRVTHYETENSATRIEPQKELSIPSFFCPDSETSGCGRLTRTPTEIREELKFQRATACAFSALLAGRPGNPVPPDDAERILGEVAGNTGATIDDESFASSLELPEDATHVGWATWTGWTRQFVLIGVAFVVSTSPSEDFRDWAPEEVCGACAVRVDAEMCANEHALREAETILRQGLRSRLLLPAQGLEKIARYETHLERSLHKTLHEIQRLQALRAGNPRALPMAVDVDLSVSRQDDRIEATTAGGAA